MSYNELTLHHFNAAATAGSLAGPRVRRGAAGDRRQGTWVQFDVQMGDPEPANLIQAVRFQAFGCPHVIAVADWVARAAVGCEAAPRLPEDVHCLSRRFAVPVEKLGRLLVVEDAWIAAISSPYNRSG